MKVVKVSGNTVTLDDGTTKTLVPNATVTINGQAGQVSGIKKDDEVVFGGPTDSPTTVNVTRP